jgi:hypothetical protein
MPFESFDEALQECVRAVGGSKPAGKLLFPEKSVEAGQSHLLRCLNPNCPEKLGLEHLILLMKAARHNGCHAAMEFLAHVLGYHKPTPVAPEDEADELRRQSIRAINQLQKITDRLSELDRQPVKLRGVG